MSENWKFQASPKIGDVMYNVRGETAQEFEANLLDFPLGAVAQFEANLRGAGAVGTMVQPAPQQAPPAAPPQDPWANQAPPNSQQQGGWGGAQPAAAPAQPQGVELHPTDTCGTCGQRPQKKIINRKSDGKQFKFWTCPNQRARNDGHYSEFAN